MLLVPIKIKTINDTPVHDTVALWVIKINVVIHNGLSVIILLLIVITQQYTCAHPNRNSENSLFLDMNSTNSKFLAKNKLEK